jgi:hypothetical protein
MDLGEATTFPLIVYYVPGHKSAPKCHFVPGLPSEEIPRVVFLAILGAHNFVCKPLIEMRFKAKL